MRCIGHLEVRARACPGKVEAGFPKRTCDNKRNREHFPIPLNREVFVRDLEKSKPVFAKGSCANKAWRTPRPRPLAGAANARAARPYAFSTSASIGSARMRLPVAAKMALQSAGTPGGSAGQRHPVGGLSVMRNSTSTGGA